MSSISEALGGLLGNAQSATGVDLQKLVGPVTEIVGSKGGLQNVLTQLQGSVIGEQVQSWVSTGANKAVSASQVAEAMPGAVSDIAAKTGQSVEQVASSLSELLPQLVDKLTPTGKVPASIEDVTSLLGNVPGVDQVKGLLGGFLGSKSAAAPAAPAE